MPMLNKGMLSSKTDEWSTPQDFFDKLNKEFYFSLDVCATAENAKADQYFDREADGLAQSWAAKVEWGAVWMNPPYGQEIGRWLKKAWLESNFGGVVIVCLLPARTDTRWFHNFVYHKAEIRFIKGRLKFGGGGELCTISKHAGNL